jgi:hypothetical protein
MFVFIILAKYPIRETFPINYASVSTGTATSAPTQAVTTRSNRSAPSKPAAPEMRAATKLDNIKIVYIRISIGTRSANPGVNHSEEESLYN